ncbi:hypothetical protein AV530_015269 [Patagioenas fasciata monilis]|uniref:Uncharacterized protein n=1 Tax=Patagioenas fasciata monilis TaxID=372326 RepID=A0A1V4K1S8_PATFA|nr:hypothetical protein AV530_015269 [Patagioenas fasciata monilis]
MTSSNKEGSRAEAEPGPGGRSPAAAFLRGACEILVSSGSAGRAEGLALGAAARRATRDPQRARMSSGRPGAAGWDGSMTNR